MADHFNLKHVELETLALHALELLSLEHEDLSELDHALIRMAVHLQIGVIANGKFIRMPWFNK